MSPLVLRMTFSYAPFIRPPAGNWDRLVAVEVFPGMPVPSIQSLSGICRGSQCQRVFVKPRVTMTRLCAALSHSYLFQSQGFSEQKDCGTVNLEKLRLITYIFPMSQLLIQNILKEVLISLGQAGCSLLDFLKCMYVYMYVFIHFLVSWVNNDFRVEEEIALL